MEREQHKRSVAKALTWRICATSTTMALVYAFTGAFTLALSIGAVEAVAKMLIYYTHERTWNQIKWGLA